VSAVDQIIVKLNGTLPCGCAVFGYVPAVPVDDGHVIGCGCGATWYLDEMLDWQRPLASVLRSELASLAAVGLGALLGGAFAAATAKPDDAGRAFSAGAVLGGSIAGATLPKAQRDAFGEALQKTIERKK